MQMQMQMMDSGAHSLEIHQLNEVIAKQERDLLTLQQRINQLEAELEAERGRSTRDS